MREITPTTLSINSVDLTPYVGSLTIPVEADTTYQMYSRLLDGLKPGAQSVTFEYKITRRTKRLFQSPEGPRPLPIDGHAYRQRRRNRRRR